jgi:hypothetical protein
MVNILVAESVSIGEGYQNLSDLLAQGGDPILFQPSGSGMLLVAIVDKNSSMSASSGSFEKLLIDRAILELLTGIKSDELKPVVAVVESYKPADLLRAIDKCVRDGASVFEFRLARQARKGGHAIISGDAQMIERLKLEVEQQEIIFKIIDNPTKSFFEYFKV